MQEASVGQVEADVKHFGWESFAQRRRQWLKGVLEGVLLEAQREWLGAEWHERSAGRRGYRNGYRRRSLGCCCGELWLRVPRNRCGGYTHRVFDSFCRRTARLEGQIIETFALGVSTRGLKRLLKGLGVGLSAQGVANVVRRLDAVAGLPAFLVAGAWHRRKLSDERYRFILLDGMWLRLGRHKRVALLAMGMSAHGEEELIDYSVAEAESEQAWEEFLTGLYLRGLQGKATQLFVSDGAGGIDAAVRENYPGIPHQLCAFHKARDIGAHLEQSKHRKEILTEAAAIYRAPSAVEARARAEDWARRWTEEEPQAVRAFLSRWERTIIYYRFEPEVWRKIRTTNRLERYLRELRRRLKSICACRNEASIDRMLYVAMRGIAARGYPHASPNKFTHPS